MAADQLGDGCLQSLAIQHAPEAQGTRNMVDGLAWLQLFNEPKSLLSEGLRCGQDVPPAQATLLRASAHLSVLKPPRNKSVSGRICGEYWFRNRHRSVAESIAQRKPA